MNIIDIYNRIGVHGRKPASQATIDEAQQRIGGQLHPLLVKWFLEANGMEPEVGDFDGRSNFFMWHFRSVEDLKTIKSIYSRCKHVVIVEDFYTYKPVRVCQSIDYAIFCDQCYYLPYYAVNIRPESPYFGEVFSGLDGEVNGLLSARTFERFAELLFSKCEDGWVMDDAQTEKVEKST